MKNKYIVLKEPEKFQYKETDIDLKLSEEEALVKIKKVGVCGTDYHAYRGNQPFFTYPRVLGHEIGLEVVQLQTESKDIEIGDRVSVSLTLAAEFVSPVER